MSEVVQCLTRPRFVQCLTFCYSNLPDSDHEDFVLETAECSAAVGFPYGSVDVVTSLPAGRQDLIYSSVVTGPLLRASRLAVELTKPPCSVEVKNLRSCTSTPRIFFVAA